MNEAAENEPPALPVWLKLVYAAGQAGNVVTDRLMAGWLLYYYLPPDRPGASKLIPTMLLGFLPLWLTISVAARGFDSFWDPFVANWSDRSRHPLGRRRIFMIVGCLPLAFVTGAVFFPPDATVSLANAAFLAVLTTSYFALYSVYVAPYLALLPQLAPTPASSLSVSTYQAFAALVGGMLPIVVGPALLMSKGQTPADVQHMVVPLAVTAFVLMALPAALIDERRYKTRGGVHSSLGLWESVRATIAEPAFLPYVIGTTTFMFGFNIVSSMMPYYVQVLMGQALDEQGKVLGATFGVAGVFFLLVNVVAKRIGKKRVMIAGALLLAVLMGCIPLLHDVTGGIVLFAAVGVPVAVLLAMPNSILADICEANALRTGQRREAMFFGTQGLFSKLNLGISTGILGLLLQEGGSGERPWGIVWSGPLASVVLVVSAVCFMLYPEKAVVEAQLGQPRNPEAGAASRA